MGELDATETCTDGGNLNYGSRVAHELQYLICCRSFAKSAAAADRSYEYSKNKLLLGSESYESEVSDKSNTTLTVVNITTQNTERPKFSTTSYTNIYDVITKPRYSFISTIHHDVNVAVESADDVAKQVEAAKLEEDLAKPSITYGDSDIDLSLSFVEEESGRKSKSAFQRFASWLSRAFA